MIQDVQRLQNMMRLSGSVAWGSDTWGLYCLPWVNLVCFADKGVRLYRLLAPWLWLPWSKLRDNISFLSINDTNFVRLPMAYPKPRVRNVKSTDHKTVLSNPTSSAQMPVANAAGGKCAQASVGSSETYSRGTSRVRRKYTGFASILSWRKKCQRETVRLFICDMALRLPKGMRNHRYSPCQQWHEWLPPCLPTQYLLTQYLLLDPVAAGLAVRHCEATKNGETIYPQKGLK